MLFKPKYWDAICSLSVSNQECNATEMAATYELATYQDCKKIDTQSNTAISCFYRVIKTFGNELLTIDYSIYYYPNF